jgi:hypothetical protein
MKLLIIDFNRRSIDALNLLTDLEINFDDSLLLIEVQGAVRQMVPVPPTIFHYASLPWLPGQYRSYCPV